MMPGGGGCPACPSSPATVLLQPSLCRPLTGKRVPKRCLCSAGMLGGHTSGWQLLRAVNHLWARRRWEMTASGGLAAELAMLAGQAGARPTVPLKHTHTETQTHTPHAVTWLDFPSPCPCARCFPFQTYHRNLCTSETVHQPLCSRLPPLPAVPHFCLGSHNGAISSLQAGTAGPRPTLPFTTQAAPPPPLISLGQATGICHE